MQHPRSQHLGQRKLPALFRLVRQARYQVDADVADPGSPQARDVGQGDSAGVQAPHRRALLVHERLHTEADTIDPAVEQRL